MKDIQANFSPNGQKPLIRSTTQNTLRNIVQNLKIQLISMARVTKTTNVVLVNNVLNYIKTKGKQIDRYLDLQPSFNYNNKSSLITICIINLQKYATNSIWGSVLSNHMFRC